MNLGRSEYTRLLKKEVRLKKAEKLIEKCFDELVDLIVSAENEWGIGRNIEEIMNDKYNSHGKFLNELKDFIDTKKV